MKIKFIFTMIFASIWLLISTYFAIFWANDVSNYLPKIYVWWVIIGIALLPGFLMSAMFFSNLLHLKIKHYPNTCQNTTAIVCAYNEELTIKKTIECICNQQYLGNIRILVVDNASTDSTKLKIIQMCNQSNNKCSIEYVYCPKPGKSNALNCGLKLVKTEHFVTVDADTFLEKNALQKIMNNIVYNNASCVAGNLFVYNVKDNILTKMQNYDYLLSIAGIKRFQGSYETTLVAQGAFSAYDTNDICNIGGWEDVLGEDIVLTYQLLDQRKISNYEPTAVAYTTVPHKLNNLYNQRKRWAIGMIEGMTSANPFKGTIFLKYFTLVNISIIYLDLAYIFGFIPGILLAFNGYNHFVGFLTIIAIIVSLIIYISMYLYQKKLNIPFKNSIIGFIAFVLFYQIIQSVASLHGYLTRLINGKEVWK